MSRRLALVAVLVLALAGCGSDGRDEASSTLPTTVTVTATETETETETVTQAPEARCSATVGRLTLPEQDLPPAVADVRKRIFDAALACDYDLLQQIAVEKGEGFTFTYGPGTTAAEHWRTLEENGEGPLSVLAIILAMPYTRNETGSYAWPTAYQESPPEAAWQALIDAHLYSEVQVDAMRAGGYVGYRTAITPDGDWQFFVAGD
jgi:hypothetical protein